MATIVRFARTAPKPWKNGRGMTTELAIHPPGAGGEDFEWRVSIAQLDTSAGFSIYPGIERCLAVLQGEMVMVRPPHAPLTLTPHSDPVRFAGSDVVEGEVVHGPVLDLNAMCKASHWRASLRRMRWSTFSAVPIMAPAVLCSISHEIDIEIHGSSSRLNLYDAVIVQSDEVLHIKANRPVEAFLIEFRRQQ